VSCTITTVCNITEDSPGVLCPVALTVFNKDLLTHCKKAEFASQHKDPAPPPDIINEEEEYEVEEIRGHRKKGRGTQFLVYWKGYENKYD